jgi:hypothetical protein
MKGRRGIRCKQLVGNVKEAIMSWHMKKEALDLMLWKTAFEWIYEPVVMTKTAVRQLLLFLSQRSLLGRLFV